MLSRLTRAAIIAGASLFAVNIAAAQGSSDLNPWQHCGIGAAIFDDNETAAAISNVIWDSGSTAVTSATVSPDTCSSEEIDVANYIDMTNDALTAELAMGDGDHVSGLLAVADCTANADDVVSAMRGSISEVSTDYATQPHADQAYATYEALKAAGWQDGSCN